MFYREAFRNLERRYRRIKHRDAVHLQKSMATKPQHVLGIFMQPGEFYFGDESTGIRTLLGKSAQAEF